MTSLSWDMTSILRATRRLPFSGLERRALFSYIAASSLNGGDLRVHEVMSKEMQRHLALGVAVLRSDRASIDFLFLKLDAGRSYSAHWKSTFLSLLGSVQDDMFAPGPTFNGFVDALSAANAMFRTVSQATRDQWYHK
jgi:hypothetical protein